MRARIRPATVEDAGAIAALVDALRLHQRDQPGHLGAEALRRDGLGADPQFAVLLAELDGELVGYALFHDAYEPAYAARGVYLCDLFVREQARHQGIGRALVAAVARDAERRGRSYVWWVSRRWNADAHALYRGMGAIEEPVNAHAIVFDVFRSLSAEGTNQDGRKG